MKNWSIILFKNWWLAVMIVALAFGLRINRYWDFPVGGETQDESAWAYYGASLLQTGQPTSWSFFAPYNPDFIFSMRENAAPLVRPALDHPPLFALLPGFFHSLKNDWQTFPSLKLTRLPMVLLGTINVALLMLVASKIFKDKKWVYLSGLIYAVAPSFVFSSRLVVAENLLVTWTLIAIWLLNFSTWRWQTLSLVAVGALAVLTKVSGLTVPVAIFVFGLASQQPKVVRAGIFGGLIGALSFVAFGAFYNFALFVEIFKSQAGRDLGLATLQNRFFLHPSIVEKIFFDGWILLGLFSAGLTLLRKTPKLLAVNIFIILNLFFVLVTSGEQTFHGWYDFILYPLLVLSLTEVLSQLFLEQNWLLFSWVWILMLPVLRMAAVHGGWYGNLPSLAMRGVASLGFLPFFLQLLWPRSAKKWSTLSWLLIVIIIVASVLAVLTFKQTAYWEEHQFFREW